MRAQVIESFFFFISKLLNLDQGEFVICYCLGFNVEQFDVNFYNLAEM